jgi:invasion protein IalB
MGIETGMSGIAKGLGLGAALLVAAGAMPVLAQEKKAPQSAWVKLCETAKVQTRGADGKPKAENKDICLTHHERLDGNTGMVIVSAAIRQVSGQDKASLMIMTPLGMALQPGVRAAVYTTEQWKMAQENKKVDETKLSPIRLKYSLCHPAGCTAEIEATADLVDSLKKGGGLMVLAINAAGQPIGFPVPLTGFTAAHDGKPVDNKLYAQERGKLMAQIRERQRKLAEARQKKAAEKK